MKTILFKTIIIAFFVGTAVSCSDEDENRFRRDLPMRNRILRSRRVDWIIPN